MLILSLKQLDTQHTEQLFSTMGSILSPSRDDDRDEVTYQLSVIGHVSDEHFQRIVHMTIERGKPHHLLTLLKEYYVDMSTQQRTDSFEKIIRDGDSSDNFQLLKKHGPKLPDELLTASLQRVPGSQRMQFVEECFYELSGPRLEIVLREMFEPDGLRLFLKKNAGRLDTEQSTICRKTLSEWDQRSFTD
jgi:hypothetical protein